VRRRAGVRSTAVSSIHSHDTQADADTALVESQEGGLTSRHFEEKCELATTSVTTPGLSEQRRRPPETEQGCTHSNAQRTAATEGSHAFRDRSSHFIRTIADTDRGASRSAAVISSPPELMNGRIRCPSAQVAFQQSFSRRRTLPMPAHFTPAAVIKSNIGQRSSPSAMTRLLQAGTFDLFRRRQPGIPLALAVESAICYRSQYYQ
jgi:hypothetical protein